MKSAKLISAAVSASALLIIPIGLVVQEGVLRLPD